MCKPIFKSVVIKSKVKGKFFNFNLEGKRVLVLRADRFGDICVSRPFFCFLTKKGIKPDIWIRKEYSSLIDLLNKRFFISVGKKFFNLSDWNIYFSYKYEIGGHFLKLIKFIFSLDFFFLFKLFWDYDVVMDLIGKRRFQIVMLIVKILKKICGKKFKTVVVYRSFTSKGHDVVLYKGDDKNLAIQYLMILEEDESKIKEFLKKEIDSSKGVLKEKKYDILIHIGYGGEQSRNWGLDNWGELINYLISKDFKIILVYSDLEPEGDILAEMFEREVKFVKNPTFKEFCDLLDEVFFYVGIDSGPFHLADLLGKQGIVLFSRENEKVWGSFTKKIKVIKKFKGICLNRKCGDNFCIKLIKPDEVINILENNLFGNEKI